MPKLNVDVVYCSPETISIGTGIIEHLPARWEVFVTVEDGRVVPLIRCKWFAAKPTRKQIRAHVRAVYAYWVVSAMYEPEPIQQKLL